MDLIYQKFGSKRRWFFVASLLVIFVFITTQSLAPSEASMQLNNMDKLAHFSAYLALGFVALPALPRIRPIMVWGMLTMYGGGIEIAQGAMQMGRKADILDAIANSSGAVLAVMLWIALTVVFTKLKT